MIDLFQKRGNAQHLPSIADRIDALGVCWEWTGYTDPRGYGRVNTKISRTTTPLVHRVVWEALIGPIPEGMTLDHLCRVRHCVNPDHLEPVTPAENTGRGYVGQINGSRRRSATHCKNGHPFTQENTYHYEFRPGVMGRYCRACRAANERKRQQLIKQAIINQSTIQAP